MESRLLYLPGLLSPDIYEFATPRRPSTVASPYGGSAVSAGWVYRREKGASGCRRRVPVLRAGGTERARDCDMCLDKELLGGALIELRIICAEA